MKERKKSYVKTPKVPPLSQNRYEAVLSVLSGQITVSQAARRLGLSRNHFQSVMHRGLAGLIEGITPGRPGRRAKSADMVSSRLQNERLLRENRQLRGRVETIERLLGVASDLLKGKVKPMGRNRPRKTTATKSPEASDDEEPGLRLDKADAMRRQGLPSRLIAAATGTSEATLRRWRRRRRLALPLRNRRGPGLTNSAPDAQSAVCGLVRRTHGLCGAASLSHSVPGISRRAAARLKAATLGAMEKERLRLSTRIVVTRPGVLRGFDQLHVPTTNGSFYALVSADGHVPYRTSLMLTPRYDGASVLEAITKDFETNGAPLVWRADRARCHETPGPRALLKRFGVLLLHGPAHLPRFYGQLERQNREHRAFLRSDATPTPETLLRRCREMLTALNTLWRRPTLEWKTASEIWTQRATLDVDRRSFLRDVAQRAALLERRLDPRASLAGLPERLAIEQALSARGLLCRIPGGWC